MSTPRIHRLWTVPLGAALGLTRTHDGPSAVTARHTPPRKEASP